MFEAIGAKVVPAPVDDEGIVLDNRSVRGARLIYVTPGHQFPLGITMSLARRLRSLFRTIVGAFGKIPGKD